MLSHLRALEARRILTHKSNADASLRLTGQFGARVGIALAFHSGGGDGPSICYQNLPASKEDDHGDNLHRREQLHGDAPPPERFPNRRTTPA
jgi:hypothetical protein